MRLLLLFVFASACVNPLAMRRAQVLRPGEFEIVVVPEYVGSLGKVDHDFAPVLALANGQRSFSATLSARVGVFRDIDVQLKLDPGLFPEVDVGYQLFGAPGELTLSVVAGTKVVAVGEGDGAARFLYVPVAVLLDVPLGESHALYGGLGLTPSFSFAAHGTYSYLAPRVFVGLSFEFFDWLVLQPEMAAQQNIVGPAIPNAGAFAHTQFSLGLGIGARL